MSQPQTPSRSARRHAAARRRRLFLIGGAVVVLIAIVVVVVLALGGSDDGGGDSAQSSSSPNDTTAATAAPTEATEPPPTTVNEAQPLPTGVCRAGQIAGSPASSGIRGPRQVMVLAFVNSSQEPCTLNGSAAIDLVTDGGEQAATMTVGGEGINPELAAQQIDLAPGGQASMVISFAPIAGPGDPGCVRATGMKVSLPDSRGKVDVDTLVTVCGGGAIAVSPLQPGVVTP